MRKRVRSAVIILALAVLIAIAVFFAVPIFERDMEYVLDWWRK